MEKQGLIVKNKKAVHMQRDAYNVQKPVESISQISKFMSILSKLLKKNKIVNNEISTKDFETLIKKNFTQCWSYFLNFQIQYLTGFKRKFFGDYETLSIWAMIVYNQNLFFNKKINKNRENKEKNSKILIDQFFKLTGIKKTKILTSLNHGWKYSSNSRSLKIKSYWSNKLNLGVCADWFVGPRVEAGWISANDLYKKINK